MPRDARPPRGAGILAGPLDARERHALAYPPHDATPGLRVVHRASGFAGTIVELAGDQLTLQGATGLTKRFRNEPGAFTVDTEAVRLVMPRVREDDAPRVD